ncbi:hypothetical protein L195_g025461 [Trifolium pratense]|uniref:Uncharacterized protein n=1 Tax=Trifolium pratense TaxID=57577 RepID=A0A2K3NGK0_TRIPR|nr:hypothetical protein L195_g025461 [Trifolium pratense]
MLSPPDFLVDIQSVVHAPSQESYFVSIHNVDVPNYSLNIVDDETLELMDFGNDSDLEFPENLSCVG